MTRKDRITQIAIGSILVALIVMAIKYWAYHVTSSVALYSDALESIVNVITAFIALYAVRVSARPADEDHPFGHHKAEYFSAVVEGALIIVAALLILEEAWITFRNPRVLTQPAEGIAINTVAAVLNAVWSFLLVRLGRRWRSPALIADGKHLLTDVLTTVGVLVGLSLVLLTGWIVLDPLLAALVAVNILWQGWRLLSESVDGLMDKAVSSEIERDIRAVISQNAGGAMEVHDLRTRAAGQAIFVEFHMVVPASMTVAESHSICDKVEDALRAAIEGVRIVIHVEPEEKAKQQGVPVL